MEDLLSSLEGAFHVTVEPNSTACPHPRYAQYKQKKSGSDQESRRKQLLEKQKSNRLDYMNLVRNLTDDDWTNDVLDEGDEETEEGMDVEQAALKKPGRYYKNQLMLSEWLVEVPGNFRQEWLAVLCPVARRCLVVASRGKTCAYTKSGYQLNRFPSALPGGHRRSQDKGGSGTILDCLYSEKDGTYYVLDLMCWNGHPVYDSETEFRFFWSHGKFEECPSVAEVSKHNPYKFVPLPSFECEATALTGALEGAQFEIDGILFFHKRTHYIFGSTPLVVWLKPYMVPEILSISVPQSQMGHKPDGYTNYAEHMKEVEKEKEVQKLKQEQSKQKRAVGQRKKKVLNVEMGDADPDDDNEKEEGIEESIEESIDGGGDMNDTMENAQ